MKKNIAIFLCCVFCSSLMGCAIRNAQNSDDDLFKLYGLSTLESESGGDAISYVTIPWESIPSENQEEQINYVIGQMLGACQNERYHSPIPSNTSLQSCTINGQTAELDFSATYGTLSGIQLSLADYCVTLSLTQLPSINSVRIWVNGHELSYRTTKTLLSSNALLTSSDDVVQMFNATIYYLDEEGQLQGEKRTLELYEGENRAEKLLSAMAEKAETEGLTTVLKEGFEVLSVRIDEEICYLNLPSSNLTLYEDSTSQNALIHALVLTLVSLEGVDSVKISVDGEDTDSFGSVDIHGLMS